MKNIDLNEKFQQYFHEQEGFTLRSERFLDDLATIMLNAQKDIMSDPIVMTKWLEAEFIQGARAMAQDTVDTLRDYATAVAGIDEVCYTSEQAFDASADNLMTYYTQILQDDEK
jgi:hypothetical protein